jgi:hypothetical protein
LNSLIYHSISVSPCCDVVLTNKSVRPPVKYINIFRSSQLGENNRLPLYSTNKLKISRLCRRKKQTTERSSFVEEEREKESNKNEEIKMSQDVDKLKETKERKKERKNERKNERTKQLQRKTISDST